MLCDRPLIKGGATTTKERFSNPVTEEDILKNIIGSIPVSTRKTTEWSVKTWREWAENQQSKCPTEVVPELEIITNEELNHWLSRFVIEVRNQQGNYYTVFVQVSKGLFGKNEQVQQGTIQLTYIKTLPFPSSIVHLTAYLNNYIIKESE